MIPKLFISPSLTKRIGEMEKILAAKKLVKNHPDLLYFDWDSKLGVEQARLVKEHFSIKPYSTPGRVVVLEDAGNLTLDAQNTLLKTLEETPEKALILMGVNSEQDLIPTVLSRCEIINLPVIPNAAEGSQDSKRQSRDSSLRSSEDRKLSLITLNDKYFNDIEKIQAFTLEERFEYIEKLKEREELLSDLLVFWREKLLKNPTPEVKKFLEELMEAEKWANQNVNIRAILEYLMLTMPSTL
jgi:DNA polymerase III subunit delta'